MYLNGHHITKFAKKRWRLTNDILAKDYLFCSKFSLSRKEPPKVEANHYYKSLFDVKYSSSAAAVFGENEKDLLLALRDYLIKNKLNVEANLVTRKVKEGSAYKEIFLEVLRRAGTQPDKNEALEESQISGALEKEKIVKIKSLIEEFDSAISEYKFVEFIRSEPLREFVGNPEIDADKSESRRIEYENKMSDIVKSLPDVLGADLATDDLDDILQRKILPYSINKLLSPTLLEMSEQFVKALIKMIPDAETSEHPAHDSILEFKNNLKLYNDYLNKHLEPKEDHFVYKLKSVVRDEKALKEAGSIEVMDVFVSTLIKHRKTEENRISLEYAIDAVDDDMNDRLAGFNSTTNHFRDMLFSLYRKIQDELFLSPDL